MVNIRCVWPKRRLSNSTFSPRSGCAPNTAQSPITLLTCATMYRTRKGTQKIDFYICIFEVLNSSKNHLNRVFTCKNHPRSGWRGRGRRLRTLTKNRFFGHFGGYRRVIGGFVPYRTLYETCLMGVNRCNFVIFQSYGSQIIND